jgi:CubicO group peptidase (beta-lactamase class C family)
MADIEKGIPWAADSLYPIMSVSKQFTTACILMLEAQGKLSLDDEVRLYLPDLPDYGASLTLRNLCTNTSGLRDYPALGVFAGAREEGGYGFEPAQKLIFGQRSLQFAPGEKYVYSNSNFFLLAMIIEKLSNMKLGDVYWEWIFKPLGMERSLLTPYMKDAPAETVKAYLGDAESGFSGWQCPAYCHGDGGILTTLDDMARWETALDEDRLHSPGLVVKLEAPMRLNDKTFAEYAMGIETGTQRGFDWRGHGGGWKAYKCFRLRFPARRLSVIVFANRKADTQGLALSVADLFLAEPVRGYAGEYYSSELKTTWRFHEESGALSFDCSGPLGTLKDVPLVHDEGDIFRPGEAARARWELEPDTTFSFERNEAGEVCALVAGTEWAYGLRFERVK